MNCSHTASLASHTTSLDCTASDRTTESQRFMWLKRFLAKRGAPKSDYDLLNHVGALRQYAVENGYLTMNDAVAVTTSPTPRPRRRSVSRPATPPRGGNNTARDRPAPRPAGSNDVQRAQSGRTRTTARDAALPCRNDHLDVYEKMMLHSVKVAPPRDSLRALNDSHLEWAISYSNVQEEIKALGQEVVRSAKIHQVSQHDLMRTGSLQCARCRAMQSYWFTQSNSTNRKWVGSMHETSRHSPT